MSRAKQARHEAITSLDDQRALQVIARATEDARALQAAIRVISDQEDLINELRAANKALRIRIEEMTNGLGRGAKP